MDTGKKFGKLSKELMTEGIAECFSSYPDFFITTFSNVSSGNMEKLRKELKRNSSLYMVTKVSMLKKAMEKAKKEALLEKLPKRLLGSCGIAFSKKDPAVAAKSLVDFSKENEGLKIQAGLIGGSEVDSNTVKVLASLPPREVLLSMLVAGFKSPISGLVGVLGNLLKNLVGVIDAIAKKKSES